MNPTSAPERPVLLLLSAAGATADEAASGVLEALEAGGFRLTTSPLEPFPEDALAQADLLAAPLAERQEPLLAPILADAALRGVPVVWLGSAASDGGERIRTLEARVASGVRAETFGRLIGGVAHDFNNILSVVTTLTELLLRFGPENNPDREDLQEIYEAARRGSDLTRQLLAFGRVEPGEARPVDLNERVKSMQKLLGKLLPEDVELRTELAGDLPRVIADPAEIDQILLELAVRARARLWKGGTVRISTGVSDEGHVLMEATSEPRRAPEAGGGADPAATFDEDVEPMRRAVARRGGRLTTSVTSSGGESLRIELPAASASPEDDAVGPPPPEQEPTVRRVLVVEDDAHVRRATCRALEALGFTPATAGSVADASAALAADPPDAVLCDAVLPDGWGTELLDRSTDGGRRGPSFVFMSGYEEHPVLHEMRAAGVPVLKKPYTGAALARALQAAGSLTGS